MNAAIAKHCLRSPLERAICIGLGLLLAAVVTIGPLPCAVNASGISFQDRHLSVDVRGQDLADVLQQIADRVRVDIVFYGDLNQTVSADFQNLDPEQGFRRLLNHCNFSFLYRQASTTGDSDPVVLNRVVVFPPNATSAAVVLRPDPQPGPKMGTAGTTETITAPAAAQPANPAQGVDIPNHRPKFTQTERQTLRELSAADLGALIDTRLVTMPEPLPAGADDRHEPGAPIPGILVAAVAADSLFARMEMQPGDIIRNVNGTAVSSGEQFAATVLQAVDGPGSGMILRIEVQRDDETEAIYVDMP